MISEISSKFNYFGIFKLKCNRNKCYTGCNTSGNFQTKFDTSLK